MNILARIALLLTAIASTGVQATPTATYYHNDLLGSPVAATNASGQVIWRESYRPYGERLTNDPNSASNKVWFTSRRQDAETGLVYMGARFYEPVAGRFISTDPKGFEEANINSFNRYAYANNNPCRYIDPNGKTPIDVGFALWDGGNFLGALGAWGVGTATGNENFAAVGREGLRETSLNAGISVGAIFLPVSSVMLKAGVHALEEGNIAVKAGEAAKYLDITRPGSVANRATDVTRETFEGNLLREGWSRSASKDGKAVLYEKDGARYSVREAAKSTGGPTADFYKAGSERPDLKIRLDQ